MDGMGEEQHLKGWRKAAKTCLRCCSSSFGPALLRILIPQSINPPLSTVLNSTGDWYLTVALNWSLTWSQSAATYECADCFAQQVDFIICEDLARDRAGICWDSTDVRIAVGAADVPKKKDEQISVSNHWFGIYEWITARSSHSFLEVET